MHNKTQLDAISPLAKRKQPSLLSSGASIELNSIAQPIYKALRILRMKQTLG